MKSIEPTQSNDTVSATEARAAELKAGGFIPQRQKSKITLRLKAPGGRLTSERLERIAQVARKYGSGLVHLSVRQSPEIINVDLADLDVAVSELMEAGQEMASCGRRFRVSTACGGCEYNPNGWVDSQRLAIETTDRFLGEQTPHKFKTCFSGCANDCPRAREADLGFQGMAEPELIAGKCTGCGLCARSCRDDALQMGEDQLPARDPDRCISCGDCIRACPFDAMIAKRVGLAVFVGGKHGRHPHASYPVAQFVSDEQAPAVIAATLDWYREHAHHSERIGETLDRVDIDSYRRALKPVVGDGLLAAADVRKPKWRHLFCRGFADALPPYGEV